jgi:hypothetical protein
MKFSPSFFGKFGMLLDTIVLCFCARWLIKWLVLDPYSLLTFIFAVAFVWVAVFWVFSIINVYKSIFKS